MMIESINFKPQRAVTIPEDIYNAFGANTGDKAIITYENGKIQIMNPAVYAMELFQKEMEGEAEKAGLDTEEKIIDFVREIRAEIESE